MHRLHRKPSLRFKTVLLLVGSVLLYLTFDALLQHFVVFPSFARLEREQAQLNMERCLQAVDREVLSLDRLCQDWAAWDDTYRFMAEPAEAYLKANFIDETLIEQEMSLLAIVDLEGRVVAELCIDLATGERLHVADFFPAGIGAEPGLVIGSDEDKAVAGLIATSRGPMGIAAQPILTSAMEGPARGTMLMGWLLDEAKMERIRRRTVIDFGLVDMEQASSACREALRSARGPRVYAVSSDHLLAGAILHDLRGKPLLLAEAELPRDITARGRFAMRWKLLSTAAAGLVVLAVTLAMLRRSIIGPLMVLVDKAAHVGAHGDLASRVNMKRGDEIGLLADQFDALLESLQTTVAQLESSNAELQEEVCQRQEVERELVEVNRRLSMLSVTDELTGLTNRRGFMEALQREHSRAQREGGPLALAMFDVDRFKQLNDTYGHPAGDAALRDLGGLLRSRARRHDIPARLAGDEFALLMPNTNAEEALRTATRIQEEAAGLLVPSEDWKVQITVTTGVGALETAVADGPHALIRQADEALYAAKQGYRGSARLWSDLPAEQKTTDALRNTSVRELQSQLDQLACASRQAFAQSVQSLVQALEARDPYARHHSENVTRYATALALQMGLPAEEVETVRRAAILHDIGKIGIPDAILLKSGTLTDEERLTMRQHVLIGVRILEQLRTLEREIPIVRHHHESWDGSGYPDGAVGRAIVLGGRILAVADAFDAITSDRSYQNARSVAEAVNILITQSDRQFDPEVVVALLAWLRSLGKHFADLTTEDLRTDDAPAMNV